MCTVPIGPNANAAPATAATTREPVMTRPTRYPLAAVTAEPMITARFSCAIGDAPSHRNGRNGMAIPRSESE